MDLPKGESPNNTLDIAVPAKYWEFFFIDSRPSTLLFLILLKSSSLNAGDNNFSSTKSNVLE